MNSLFDGYAFRNIKILNLSTWNTSNVKSMRFMFNDCKNLETIKFSKAFNTSKVTNMNYMFAECSLLK